MLQSLKSYIKELKIYWTIHRSGLFDREYYLRKNMDVARNCINPLKHYIRHGWHEGRNPNPRFDTKGYLKKNQDVFNMEINPLYHYIIHGGVEGLRVILAGKCASASARPEIQSAKPSELSRPKKLKSSVEIKIPDTECNEEAKDFFSETNWVYRITEAQLLERVRSYNKQKSSRKADVVVFTAIIGGYDQLVIPEYITDQWDYVCFSDVDIPGEHIYEIRYPNYYDTDPARMARFIKTHPSLYFPEYQYAVWLDPNILIRGPHLENSVMDCIHRGVLVRGNPHPNRNCVSEELTKCVSLEKDDRAMMENQVARYLKVGFPVQYGMMETGILIYKPGDYCVKRFTRTWWKEINQGSRRDQLSIMYALWKEKVPYEYLSNMKDIRYHEDNDYCLFLHGGKSNTIIPPYSIPCFMKEIGPQKTLVELKPFDKNTLTFFQKEKIDIVICVHNALEEVQRCLQSVLAALLPSHRLILVDDGSDAETADYLKNFPCPDSRQKILIRNETPLGYTRAANIGLKASDAPFVIMLNSDTVVPPNWALKLLQAARSMPMVGIVGPMSNAASWQSAPYIHDSQTGRLMKNELPRGLMVKDMDELCERSAVQPIFPYITLINGFCYAIKREVIETIGYFDEEAFPQGYGEEDDYSMRAVDAGFIHAVATNCYVYHQKSKSYGTQQRDLLAKQGGSIIREKYGAIRITRDVQNIQRNPCLRTLRLFIEQALSKLPSCQREPITQRDFSESAGIIPWDYVADIQVFKSLIEKNKIEFIDFGCSNGGSVEWIRQKTGCQGIGFDVDSRKLKTAKEKILCCNYDILMLPNEKLVSFVTIFHMLEHLDSLKQVRTFITKACAISRNNVYIKQPYFDADNLLFHQNFKTYYSDWTGHRNRMTTPDFYYHLQDLRKQRLIRDFILAYRGPINDSSSNIIHSLLSPKDSLHYDLLKHPAKQTGVVFNYPVFNEILACIDIDGLGFGCLWTYMTPSQIVYDSREGKPAGMV